MESCPSDSVNKLLEYREKVFGMHLEIGRVLLESLDVYRDLARKAAEDNILAGYLPQFSMSLLDQNGAQGEIETAYIKELHTL